MNVNKSFVDVDEIKFYHSLSNVLYMLAPITGGITAIPAAIVDVKLDEVLDDTEEKMTIKNSMCKSIGNFVRIFEKRDE